MTLAAGVVIETDVERAVAGGRMLARYDGAVVLIAGAVPGERIRARLSRVTRQVAFADTVEVLDASPDRREPRGNTACGGLAYAHIAYDRQRRLKGEVIADAFRRLGHLTLAEVPAVAASPEDGYRVRARLHVRGGRAGFFEEGTHTLCDAQGTGQLRPAAHGAVADLLGVLRADTARLDSVVTTENLAGTERVLHLEPRAGERLDDIRLGDECPSAATGVTVTLERGVACLTGQPYVKDTSADLPVPGLQAGITVRWQRQAPSFFQGNRFLTPTLLAHVLDRVTTDRVVDLYAGVGLYAVALAARGALVAAVEGHPSSAADLRANAVPWRERLRVHRASVEDVVRRPPDPLPGTMIVNPPRSGISAAAITQLVAWNVPQVVYVSCDPPTLARDASRFTSAGYAIRSVQAFDLFPNTPHVETVVEFGR